MTEFQFKEFERIFGTKLDRYQKIMIERILNENEKEKLEAEKRIAYIASLRSEPIKGKLL